MTQIQDFAGRSALVTGAASGIAPIRAMRAGGRGIRLPTTPRLGPDGKRLPIADSESGKTITAEIRNDGAATVPEVGAKLHARFDAARASLLPDANVRA